MSNVSGSSLRSKLPPGWSWQCLGDVLKVRNGFAFKSSDYQERGVLLIRQSNLGGNRVSLEKAEYLPDKFLKDQKDFRVTKGDVLIGMSGSIGKLCVYDRDEPALQNQRTGLLQFKDDSLKSWIWHYLPLIENNLHEGGKGVGVQNISTSQIEALPIPIAPKDQRDHIVAEMEKQLSRLDEAVGNLKRIKANLKRYKAAVLKAAIEGKLTEDWRKQHPDVEPASKLLERILAERRAKWTGKGKYKEPAEPDTSSLPSLPKGWAWTSLEQLSWDSSYGTSVKCGYDDSGPRVLRIPNIASGKLDFKDLKCAPNSFQIERGEELSIGDVLIIRTNGSRSLIGRSAVVKQPLPSRSTYASYLIRFRLVPQSEIIAWVSTIWDWDMFRQWIEQRAATSAGQHNISMTVLATLPIPLPPTAEQQRIVAEIERRLSVIEELEVAVEVNLKRAERFRQSVLQQAFAGRLIRTEPLSFK